MWDGRLSEIVAHLKICEQVLLPCPLGCTTGAEDTGEQRITRVSKALLPQHLNEVCPLRRVTCEHCTLELTVSSVSKHAEECDVNFTSCPNHCLEEGVARSIRTKELRLHLENDCPLQEIDCPYNCGYRLLRKDIEKHEIDSNVRHTSILLKNQIKLETENKSLRQRIQELSEKTSTLLSPPKGCINWKIEKFKHKFHQSKVISSEPFYVGYYKCVSYVNFNFPNKGDVAVFNAIMKGEYDDTLSWPISYKYVITLVSREEGHESYTKFGQPDERDFEGCLMKPVRFRNEGIGIAPFISCGEIMQDSSPYYVQDNIILKVSVEMLPQGESSHVSLIREDLTGMRSGITELTKRFLRSKQAVNEWEIVEITESISEKRNLKCSPFFVEFFKFQCALCFDYKDSGYLACFVHILKGCWDSSLNWPFAGKYILTLKSQNSSQENHCKILTTESIINSSKYFQKPVESRNAGYGFSKFISHKDIIENYCSQNDSFIITLLVESM